MFCAIQWDVTQYSTGLMLFLTEMRAAPSVQQRPALDPAGASLALDPAP